MKKIKSYIRILMLGLCGLSVACSDEYMGNMNTDPTKTPTINPNAQLTTAQLQTYGDTDLVSVYRSYIYGFTQQLMGCWNTTNFGGRHTLDNSEMGKIWTNLYAQSIKNLVDGIHHTNGDQESVNINAIMRIFKVYQMSLITDIYGDCPCSEAGLGYIDDINTPYYDYQQDIYSFFFKELTEAVAALNPAKDRITGDLIYHGNVSQWKKLGNALRLRFAMRISDVEPQKARTEFEAAINDPGGLFSSSADDALIHYMNIAFSFGQESYADYRGNALSKILFGNDPANNPSYICSTLFNRMRTTNDPRTFMLTRCYFDGLMTAVSPENRIDLTEEMLSKNALFNPCKPGAFSWEPWPQGYESDLMHSLLPLHPDLPTYMQRETEPKLANNFLKSDNPGVVMTFAELKLLMAEAQSKGWDTGNGSVADLYEEGVRAAMDFLSDNYGCERVTTEDFNRYIRLNGVGDTPEQQKENINTQAWILHFTNPAECWANLRRSGYPLLKSPAEYGFEQFLTGGIDIPVRLCYPVLESSYNKSNYQNALDRMGGVDSWNSNIWWDI